VRRRRHRLCVRSPSCVRRAAYHPGLEQLNPIYYYYCALIVGRLHYSRARPLARCLGRAGPITIFSGRMLMQKGTLSTGTQRVKRGSGGHHSSLWFSLYSLGACLKIAFLSLVEKTGAHRAVRSLVRSFVRPRSSYSIRHLSIFIFVLSGSHACVRASGKVNKKNAARRASLGGCCLRVSWRCATSRECGSFVHLTVAVYGPRGLKRERERGTQTQIGSRGLEPCQRRIYT
jgi:hypothetical protein